MSFGDGDYVGNVFGFGADSALANGNVHVGGVFLEYLNRAQ
jgi:hypothetical protein